MSPVGKMTNKKPKIIQRSEASQNISEFNLTEVGKERVQLNDLIKASKKAAGQILVKKQLKNTKKLKSLSVPLNKPQLEKIKRTIAYDKVCDEVEKWDEVVKNNRNADQIVYPLQKPGIHFNKFENVAENFVTKHPVEEAVSKLLKGSDNVLEQTKPLTAAEEKALQAMSLEEAKLRHNELMKHRALISYQEARARRRNKIKSKRYHRILKREKLKKMMKEFEELQKTDAAAALQKFLEADKLRILERMTLKHRNTGKWAKQQKLRAKYNPESRSSLKEDIAIGRQMREKLSAVDTVSVLEARSATSVESDITLIRDDGIIEETTNYSDIDALGVEEDSEWTTHLQKSLIPESNISISQESSAMTPHAGKEECLPKELLKIKDTSVKSQNIKKTTVEDNMEFSSDVTCLNSMVPDDITFGDEDIDDKSNTKVTINQAFADEDFIAEFREEKKMSEKANKPETLNLYLPGWGSWGGPGIKPLKRKKRRFTIKPAEPVTKKSTLDNVIINEDKDKKAADHQVSHLPFPFTKIRQFESYIRQPIGHTWNPQSSFQNLIAPKVITKIGKIIEPIDAEDAVFKKTGKKPKTKKIKDVKTQKAF